MPRDWIYETYYKPSRYTGRNARRTRGWKPNREQENRRRLEQQLPREERMARRRSRRSLTISTRPSGRALNQKLTPETTMKTRADYDRCPRCDRSIKFRTDTATGEKKFWPHNKPNSKERCE